MGKHIRTDRDSSRGRTIRRLARLTTGLIVGASLFATGNIALAGEGGAGSDGGGAGTGGDGRIVWTYKDSYGEPNLDSLQAALADTSNGKSVPVVLSHLASEPAASTAQNALNQAVAECQTRYASNHGGNSQGANCRLVSVGMVETNGYYTGHTGSFTQSQWLTAWNQSGIGGRMHSHNNITYTTHDTFTDNATSVETLVNRESAERPAIIVVVLSDDEPPIKREPPASPSKSISAGTSADNMTNITTISSGTGVGGKALVFRDRIDPHGTAYTVTGQRVSDGGTDISAQFDFAQSADLVSATWKGGDLPERHTFEWSLDITVTRPAINTITDTGSVAWDDDPEAYTEQREFPTWRPNPDKAWIRLGSDGSYQGVIDPAWSNSVGLDGATVLDGDHIAAVVNAPVSSGLAQAPTTFTIVDDFAAADYLVDLGDLKQARVFLADADQGDKSSVTDITKKGTEVTAHFAITQAGTRVEAKADQTFLDSLKGRQKAAQVSLFVPFTVNYANGGGTAKVRADYGKQAGDELAFCTAPGSQDSPAARFTNIGWQTVNNDTEKTNQPQLCGYVPSVRKDVLSEASQGGDQSSINGKGVLPGQKVEYELTTSPRLPQNLAHDLTSVSLTDNYSPYATIDKQTLEVTDLASGNVIAKSKYNLSWTDSAHRFVLTFTPGYVSQHWKAGSNPRLLVRFEARVNLDAPLHQTVDNQWSLKLDNSLIPSNKVKNPVLDPKPGKQDTQAGNSIDVNGKTAFLGDILWYRIKLDAANLTNSAYKVSRLGIVDDYDDQYLQALTDQAKILDASGTDVTAKFNVQVKGGVFYAFFKTVDTLIPASGQVVPGNPQPSDLKAYSEKELNRKTLNRQTGEYETIYDPAIDQSVLGQDYQVILPAQVIKVGDGHTVKNQATQVSDNSRTVTNQVTNLLPKLDPRKDVLVNIGEGSRDKGQIPLSDSFLYQLDSSVLPPGRAYPTVSRWILQDDYDQAHDQYAGHWAVYAKEAVVGRPAPQATAETAGQPTSQGTAAQGGATAVLYQKGEPMTIDGIQQPTDQERLAGHTTSAWPAFFTFTERAGAFNLAASAAYLQLVSANNSTAQQWSLFAQFIRVASGSVENAFTETLNKASRQSNTVRTSTPAEKAQLTLEKYDVESGLEKGDRDDPAQALSLPAGQDTRIGFLITNTGEVTLHKLTLADTTINGSGTVHDIEYPKDWDSLELKPGQSITLYGTLSGVKPGDSHTDDATVQAIAERRCPIVDPDPFDHQVPAAPAADTTCDGQRLTAHDPWNGKAAALPTVPPLAHTGSSLGGLGLLTLILGGGGLILSLSRFGQTGARRRADRRQRPRGRKSAARPNANRWPVTGRGPTGHARHIARSAVHHVGRHALAG